MTADVLEVALEFGRELCAKNETTKAKVVSALIAEVKEHRAKAEAPVDLEPLKVAIDAAKDSAVTLNDGGPITAADLLQHSGARSVVGHIVLTRDNGRPGSGWEAGAVEARKWSVTGVVTDYADGHGLGFKVKHDDGSEAWYEPEHLVLRARKEPLRSCLDVIRECGARAVLRKVVADRYAVGRMRGVVQRITEHHEAGTTRLECHVVHDDGSSWTRDAGELVVLEPLKEPSKPSPRLYWEARQTSWGATCWWLVDGLTGDIARIDRYVIGGSYVATGEKTRVVAFDDELLPLAEKVEAIFDRVDVDRSALSSERWS